MSGASPDAAAGAEAVLRAAGGLRPRVHLVLGSGLGALADALEDPVEIPFGEVPGLPATGVEGHAGRFLLGGLEGGPVLVQSGRFHLYEGHPARRVTAPLRIGARVGAEAVVLTNAAGAIGRGLAPGSILLLDDQIDLTFRSPLRAGAPGDDAAPPPGGRRPGLRASYDPDLRAVALAVARRRRIPSARGTYAGVVGPSYETPAEIRMLSRLGADAVGMSTVLEVVEARACGLAVLGLSLITNRAAGRGGGALGHRDVVATAERTGGRLEQVVRGVLRKLFGGGGEPGRENG